VSAVFHERHDSAIARRAPASIWSVLWQVGHSDFESLSYVHFHRYGQLRPSLCTHSATIGIAYEFGGPDLFRLDAKEPGRLASVARYSRSNVIALTNLLERLVPAGTRTGVRFNPRTVLNFFRLRNGMTQVHFHNVGQSANLEVRRLLKGLCCN
jgi:hypothetical protein